MALIGIPGDAPRCGSGITGSDMPPLICDVADPTGGMLPPTVPVAIGVNLDMPGGGNEFTMPTTPGSGIGLAERDTLDDADGPCDAADE